MLLGLQIQKIKQSLRERESTNEVKYVAILKFRVNSSRDFNWELWLIIRLGIIEYLLVLKY